MTLLISSRVVPRNRLHHRRYGECMPLLEASDALRGRPRRVLVAGTSGSGKTTFGRRLAQELSIPHVEVDSLFHGTDWTPRQSFEADVRTFSEGDKWVTEWQYGVVRDLWAERADLLVWLDLSRITVMYQIIRRTLRRRLHREVLWNGNIEPPLRTFLTDHQHIVRWAWNTHHKTAEGGGVAGTPSRVDDRSPHRSNCR